MGKGGKKKGGRKLSPEERLEAELAEAKALKNSLDQERKNLIDELKTGIDKEILEGQEKLQSDLDIQAVCLKQLEETERKFKRNAKLVLQKKMADNEQERWDQYMKCDKVPDAALVAEVHNYIYRWEIDEIAPFPENCKWRIKSAVQLLEKLQAFIDEPFTDSPQYHANLKEVKERAREHLRQQIDRTTYFLLRDMEGTMETRGLNQLQLSMANEYFSLCVWGILPYPKTCFPIPKEQRPALVCNFEEITMNVTVPDLLWGVPHALRLVQLKYDNLSDYCSIYFPPPLPDHLTVGLKTAVTQDWQKRLEYEKVVAEERETRKQEIEAIARIKINPLKGKDVTPKMFKEQIRILKDNLETLKMYKETPIKTASERLIEVEDSLEATLKTELIPELRPGELNLRQYMLLGGVYSVHAVSQPPQPMELLSDYMMTTLQLPKELKTIPVPEEPCEVEPIGPAEDLEAELERASKRSFKSGAILASVLDSQSAHKSVSKIASLSASKSAVKSGSKLGSQTASQADLKSPSKVAAERQSRRATIPEITVYLPLVNLSLPLDFLWYQPPVVAAWDEDENMWSTEIVHDFMFQEEDQTLAFSMSMFGSFALAVDRHTNLPYNTWEMKPGENATVTFSLTTPVITLNFTIKDDVIILTETSKMKPNRLQEIIEKECSLYQLEKSLLQKGMNIFPDNDTHCYIEGCMPKHRATEDQLYHCMAQLSKCYRFIWSPQNHDAGHRKIILRMQEYSSKATDMWTLYVSPGKTSMIKSDEVPQNGEQPAPSTKTYADLFQLIKKQASFSVQEGMAHTSPVLIETVYAFLRKIKVLSFSN